MDTIVKIISMLAAAGSVTAGIYIFVDILQMYREDSKEERRNRH